LRNAIIKENSRILITEWEKALFMRNLTTDSFSEAITSVLDFQMFELKKLKHILHDITISSSGSSVIRLKSQLLSFQTFQSSDIDKTEMPDFIKIY
jgi:hypothetical protein